MNCINKLNEPHPFKRVRLFGPGMNVKEQNHNRGNLSDDGINMKIAYKSRSSTKKEDVNIFYFNEHKDYCVSLYGYKQYIYIYIYIIKHVNIKYDTLIKINLNLGRIGT